MAASKQRNRWESPLTSTADPATWYVVWEKSVVGGLLAPGTELLPLMSADELPDEVLLLSHHGVLYHPTHLETRLLTTSGRDIRGGGFRSPQQQVQPC
ncbi:hypothetical protein, variant [Phytophthora nicotianae]|uniref:Uncharacterized protein n=3 Tax=Phytophthora nicotianae TaxID=4792 RepID=V9G0H1_PHYNI|nr:hypothetical protein PPTG_00351 [Phytophthora nicotianae INRA-310]XP_008889983.1 hypothetical protein, variant [Phytophthora nicotianae INRA-310]ETI57229.1 hypothetical protein F443_00428 [Phytophthora nicotianae P1569]ETM03402.1 hypothetical protein L917_00373 [Phytophthora nicotianae]ETI57230.1 hypothetical protein, variant [Phytophthora nicotianae P1569]ETM03403.1 hypothetical protein, variant [Phytophthora nicotianae]ETM56661.1 hypothetical protein L914_00403 [Phytophthora nicotianae]